VVKEELGGQLQRALREAGLTEGDLAQGDLTPVYIKMIACGQIRPSLEVVQSLADRLGKPVSHFLEGLPGSRADALLLLNLATGYLEQEDTERAKPLLEQAQKYATDQKDRRIEGLVEMQWCRMHRIDLNLREAEKHGGNALKCLQNHGEPDEIAQAMMYLGNVAWVQRNLYEALARYQDALVIARNSGNRNLLVRLYCNIGNTLVKLEEFEPAERYLDTAAQLAQEESDVSRQAKSQMNLALTYRERGDLDRALDLSVKALACLDEGHRPTITADVYNHMGTVHVLRGARTKAIECFQRTLVILQHRSIRQVIEARREMARLSLEEGHIQSATEQAKAALAAAEELADDVERARCSLMYAQALMSGDSSNEAYGYLVTAESLFRMLGIRQSLIVAQDMLRHIETAQRQGDSGQAKEGHD